MKEEEIICKNCKKPIDNEEEKIFDGYCEKCYHKWMKHKRKNTSNIDNKETTLVLYELSILCSIIAMAILIIAGIMFVPVIYLVGLNILGAGLRLTEISEPIMRMLNTINILFISEIGFSIISLILGLISRKKYKHKKTNNIGLKLSIIELIISIILYLRIYI